MDEDVACGADDVTTPGDGQAWQELFLDGSGTYEVQWDTAAAVTPMGALVYVAQYLSTGGVLGRLTSTHAMAARIQVVLSRIGECFNLYGAVELLRSSTAPV